MSLSQPLTRTPCPPRGNIGSRVQTTSQEVIFHDSESTTESNDPCGKYICRLVIGVIILLVGSAIKSSSRSSSSSTYSYSTPTVYSTNRNSPSSTSYGSGGIGEDRWTSIFTQAYYQQNVVSATKESCDTTACQNIVAESLNSVNKSVDPCDNFYDYACQGWQESNPRPEYMAEWSVFSKLRMQTTETVIGILEKPVTYSEPKPLSQAKLFYRRCLNNHYENKSEAEDNAAIQIMLNHLEKYGGWPILYENGTWNKSRFDWIQSTVALKRQFKSSALVDVSSFQYPYWLEKRNTIRVTPTSPSSSSLEAIDKFVELNKILEGFKSLLNLQNLVVNISKAFLEFQGKTDINETYLEDQALDTVLVQVLLPSAGEPSTGLGLRDQIYLGMEPNSNVARTTLGSIQTVLDRYMLPFENEFNILKLVQSLYKNSNIPIRRSQSIILTDVSYLLNLAKFISETKEDALANYLHFRMTLLMIPLTGHTKLNSLLDDFQNELSGTTGTKPSKEICAGATQEQFKVAVGQAFVSSKYHNDLEFKQAKITFHNLKVSFTKLIESSYMPYLNKTQLKIKTKATSLCLGYPSWMRGLGSRVQSEYRGLVLNESASYFEQSLEINKWAVDKSYGLLTKQLKEYDDDAECQWTKFPGYVGAHNALVQFTVYLPIGIMELPFFDISMPLALIYGKLGSILGHELMHGLVGPGWSELKNGSLTPSGQCLVNQYSNFSTSALRKENVTLNGVLSLEENIPDNAGLLGAFQAFKQSISLHSWGKKLKELSGFTEDQLFFLGFAQNWCATTTQITMRKSLENEDHPPGMFRVLGTLQNSQEFATAWKCPLGSNMNPFPKDHKKYLLADGLKMILKGSPCIFQMDMTAYHVVND